MSETTIGFMGLGDLGSVMAKNLVDRGHSLRVWNRTASKAEPLTAVGATHATRPSDTVVPGGVVISVLWDDAALQSVVESEGFLEHLGAGGLHISMSTVSPEAAMRVAALHARHGSTYVEAPVFGRPEAARERKLYMPISGPASAKERARPLLEAMGAEGIFDFGEAIGAAVLVKLIGNFMIISGARSMGEGLAIARASGLDPRAVVEMLTTTLFDAPIYRSYGKLLVENPSISMQRPIPAKDLGLFDDVAKRLAVDAPVSRRLRELVTAPR